METEELVEKIREILKKEISDKYYKKFFVYGFDSAEVNGTKLIWTCKDELSKQKVSNYYKPFILAACTSAGTEIKEIEVK
ncbi:MAG: hypothetical protein PUE01_12605 [Clostridiaceae bacterium]|nr:hypothetical protein [Clostridiaceae bacterium]